MGPHLRAATVSFVVLATVASCGSDPTGSAQGDLGGGTLPTVPVPPRPPPTPGTPPTVPPTAPTTPPPLPDSGPAATDAATDAAVDAGADANVDARADAADAAPPAPVPPIPPGLLGRVGRLSIQCQRTKSAPASLRCRTYMTSRSYVCDAQVDMVGDDVQLANLGNCTVATGTSTCDELYSTACGVNCVCPPGHPLSKPGTPATPTDVPPPLFAHTYSGRVVNGGTSTLWLGPCTLDGATTSGCVVGATSGFASADILTVPAPDKLSFSFARGTARSCSSTSGTFAPGGWRGPDHPVFLDVERCTATFE